MKSFRNTLGFLLQFAALVFLPVLIVWQLDFGIPLLVMPSLTIAALTMFYIGHSLRDKTE